MNPWRKLPDWWGSDLKLLVARASMVLSGLLSLYLSTLGPVYTMRLRLKRGFSSKKHPRAAVCFVNVGLLVFFIPKSTTRLEYPSWKTGRKSQSTIATKLLFKPARPFLLFRIMLLVKPGGFSQRATGSSPSSCWMPNTWVTSSKPFGTSMGMAVVMVRDPSEVEMPILRSAQ